MPSRYLLIEFDDADAATSLRARIDNATQSGKKYRVVGLFAKPSGYCQCDPRTHVTSRSGSTLKRGKKFGWWVCTKCKRPTASLSGLVNLIKPRDIVNPPKWLAKHWQHAKPFEAMHYIVTLSGLPIGHEGVEYWSNR